MILALGAGLLVFLGLHLALAAATRSGRHGRVRAAVALLCGLAAGWGVRRFLVTDPALTVDDGIEVPIVPDFRPDPEPRSRPTVRIRADGTGVHEPLDALARRMEQERGIPDETLLLRVDRRVAWTDVRRFLSEIEKVRIWKLHLAARGQDPKARRIVGAYLSLGVVGTGAPATETTVATLRVGANGTLHLNGAPCAHLGELRKGLRLLPRPDAIDPDTGARLPGQILLQPDDGARWGDVMAAVDAARERFEVLFSGPLPLLVPREGP